MLGYALEVVVDCAAYVLNVSAESVRTGAKLQLLGGSSLKAALDIDWDKDDQQALALSRLLDEVKALRGWLEIKLPNELDQPPLKEALALVDSPISQDIEPDRGGGMRIKRGVAKDRRTSIVDADMRHGRKSKTKMLLKLRALKSTADGRKQLRERVSIEHALAHVGRRQGPRTRYIGVRKNVFDLRRTTAVENLVTLNRPLAA